MSTGWGTMSSVETVNLKRRLGVAKWQATKRGAWLPLDMICCWLSFIRSNRVWLNHPGYTLVAKETASTYRNHIYVGYHGSAVEKPPVGGDETGMPDRDVPD